MSEAINSLADAIERLYRSFVLRDVVGYLLPGSVFISSAWLLGSGQSDLPRYLANLLRDWMPSQLIAFLAASYLGGVLIQSVHYGIVDWVYQLQKKVYDFLQRDADSWPTKTIFWLLKTIFLPLRAILWPVAGIFTYARQIIDVAKIDNPSLIDSPSLMTIGALALDAAPRSREEKSLSKSGERDSYTERLSVLMLITSNLAIASVPLLILAIKFDLHWCYPLGGALILLFLYLEHWRLLYARNLRHKFLAEAGSSDGEFITG